MKRYLDYLAIADPEAAQRLQHHLGEIHFQPALFPMEKAVQEIIEALCVEISFGRTLADGIGRMLVTAITTRDILLVQGGVLVVATCYVLFNLAADVVQHILDPRISI